MAELDFTDLFEQLHILQGRRKNVPLKQLQELQDMSMQKPQPPALKILPSKATRRNFAITMFVVSLAIIVPLIIHAQTVTVNGVTVMKDGVAVQQPTGLGIVDADGQPAAWVTDGVYEIPAFITMPDGNQGWCWKSSLQRFGKDHPDERIVSAVPSFYFYNDWKGIPQKYFIFTVKKVRAEIE